MRVNERRSTGFACSFFVLRDVLGVSPEHRRAAVCVPFAYPQDTLGRNEASGMTPPSRPARPHDDCTELHRFPPRIEPCRPPADPRSARSLHQRHGAQRRTGPEPPLDPEVSGPAGRLPGGGAPARGRDRRAAPARRRRRRADLRAEPRREPDRAVGYARWSGATSTPASRVKAVRLAGNVVKATRAMARLASLARTGRFDLIYCNGTNADFAGGAARAHHRRARPLARAVHVDPAGGGGAPPACSRRARA